MWSPSAPLARWGVPRALFEIAKSTPFALAGVTSAAKQLLAFGFGAQNANRSLINIADAPTPTHGLRMTFTGADDDSATGRRGS